MREIRFRAWDKKTKIMVKVNEIYSPVLEEGYEHEKGDQGYHVTGKKGYCPPAGQLILMQYTGLKDKNGTEYFFEDIGEFDNGDRFIIKCEDYLMPYVEWIGDPECEDQARDFHRISNARIIGNIYENPELLTSQDETN